MSADRSASSTFPAFVDLWSKAPRARWWQRALQVAPVRGVLGLFFVILASSAGAPFFHRASARWGAPAAAAAESVVLCGALAAFAFVVERRRPREFGLRLAFLEWLAGIALGGFLLAFALALLLVVGAYRTSAGNGFPALLAGAALFAPRALAEELYIRAIVFKLTEESLGSRIAIATQALVFGFLHIANPHATVLAALAIAVEAGVLLAAAYMLTRRLWFAWGIHFGWNLTQGTVFGVPVSGHVVGNTWWRSTPLGPAWLDGGAFGLEASPVAVIVCVGAALVLLHLARKRGQIVTYATARAARRA